MAVGVIIARLQPIHKGHLELVRQALVENDKVLILVGSADKLNKRNPIPIAMRLELAKKAIAEEFGDDANKVEIKPLNDLTDESDNSHDWWEKRNHQNSLFIIQMDLKSSCSGFLHSSQENSFRLN